MTYNLNGFKFRINKTPIDCKRTKNLFRKKPFFLNWFFVCFNLFVLLFVVTPCLVVAVQSCMEWIPFVFLFKKYYFTDSFNISILLCKFLFNWKNAAKWHDLKIESVWYLSAFYCFYVIYAFYGTVISATKESRKINT